MHEPPTDRRLEAFLDETLPVEEATAIERRLRDDPELNRRLAEIAARRDRGDHSLGAVWHGARLTCPDRATLGSYLLGLLDDDRRRFVETHIDVVGCRYCRASLDDLRERRGDGAPAAAERRQKLFHSSVGRLRKG